MEPVTKYGVMNREKDDYLSTMDRPEEGVLIKIWHTDPAYAMKFDTPEEAQKALEEVQSRWPLEVVTILETDTHFWVSSLSPSNAKPEAMH